MEEITVLVADASHEKYVDTILDTMAAAAKVRGTGIARRSHDYLATKMRETKAVIALAGDRFAGFSYIETWGNKHYVTTSGLIVHPDFRGLGVSNSGSAVMKMNTQLGYVPVTFADLTDDEAFWRGCDGCINVDVLKRTGRRYCICTGMLYDPAEHRGEPTPIELPEEVMKRIGK